MAQLSGGPNAGTPDAVGKGISGLAWQLRSNALAVEDGRAVIWEPMLQTATPATRAIVEARRAAINKILDAADYHPESLEELKTYFEELENLK